MANEFTEWCQVHFALMADGGIWGVPRSGLTFTKRGDKLVLTERMPFAVLEEADAIALGKDVPDTPEKLRAYQDADYETIREQFHLAGIEVENGID